MSALLLAWLTEAGLMTWRIGHVGRPDAAGGGKVPWPADYTATFIIFGGLGLLAEAGGDWPNVSAAFGWALVLATFLNLYNPAGSITANPQGQVAVGPTKLRPSRPVPSGG